METNLPLDPQTGELLQYVELVDGPSKEALRPGSTVTFRDNKGRVITATIGKVEAEDGSGESWNITGFAKFAGDDRTFLFKGYFTTRRRTGCFTPPDKR